MKNVIKISCVILILISISILFYLEIVRFVRYYEEDPCGWEKSTYYVTNFSKKSRLAYCLDWFPRDQIGGGIFSYGITEQYSAMVIPNPSGYHNIKLSRNGENIIIDDKYEIERNEEYNSTYLLNSDNPLLISVINVKIINKGYDTLQLDEYHFVSQDTVFISGFVEEKWILLNYYWIPGVMGIFILGIEYLNIKIYSDTKS